MGSSEGFGGGVVVTEVGRLSGGVCSSGVQKDIHVDNMSVPASWCKIPVSELCKQGSQPTKLHNKDIAKNSCLENMNSPALALDVGDKLLIGRTCEISRINSVLSKRSGMVPMEVSDSKSGLFDAEGMFLELASCPACSNTSEKTLVARKSSLVKRGNKRNGKMHKNRCDSISLKNGLVSFNSAAGGNNFFGSRICRRDEYIYLNFRFPSISAKRNHGLSHACSTEGFGVISI